MLKPQESGLDHLTIDGRLPGLNDYINAERRHRMIAAKMKIEMEEAVTVAAVQATENGTLHSHRYPCELWITFVEKNHRRDLDNISFAVKAIQDALVRFGVFPDDSTKYINLLHYTVAFDSNRPRIEVIIRDRRKK